MTFKPMLASPANLDIVKFPVLASPKLDGIRCVVHEGQAKSRMLKPIPNCFVRETLSSPRMHDLDGEIVTYTDGKLDDFNTTQSKIMTQDGVVDDFMFYAFDNFKAPMLPFVDRIREVPYATDRYQRRLPHELVQNLDDLHKLCEQHIQLGYEGTMIRSPSGHYKFGRSTAREQGLLKIKRFHDAEAVVVGLTELMRNGNEATTNALGRTERSSHKANMIPSGTMGTIVANWNGVEFEIGTGYTQQQRQEYWHSLKPGTKITFKYQEVSKYGVPRFPVFLGIRRDLD